MLYYFIIMKKQLLFLFAIMVAISSYGQTLEKSYLRKAPLKAPLTNGAATDANVQQNWWGYVTNETSKMGLGVKSADTYHCAIFIPGNHAVASGKTIKSVRFGLTASHATDAKVWLASSLPSAINESNTLQIVDVSQKLLGKESIDVELNTPYAIPAEGVYVGYTFTITSTTTQDDQYPILVTGEDAPNALLIRTDQAVPQWSDMNGYGYGSLFLQVLSIPFLAKQLKPRSR